MAVDNTRYNVPFRAPALPYPPKVYDAQSFEEFNKVLRIYFNQLDNALRNAMAVQEPYNLQVSKGQIAGASTLNVFGFNPAVGTTFISPWELAASTQYVFPSSAVVMALVSSSASDTAVQVLVNGLDADYVAISETITLNGTVAVNTTKSYLRINSAVTVGSTNALGNISITNGGVTYGYISIGVGRTQMAQYTVPAGSSFYLERINCWSATSTGASKYLRFRNRVQTSTGVIYDVAQATFSDTPLEVYRDYPFKYNEKTSIQFQVLSSSGTNEVSVAAEGVLIDN
jgi:hypothetical protein